MSTVELQTEEGHEVSLAQRDYEVLKSWPRLDITRLVVVGEDAVHARRTDGTVHPQSLEDLLCLVQTPVMPRNGNVRPGGMLDRFVNPPRAFKGRGSGPIVVNIKGIPVRLRSLFIDGDSIKVPVVAADSWDVVAWARVPGVVFGQLQGLEARPDTLAWRMGTDGRPTTRIKRWPDDIYVQPVQDLMGEYGMDPSVIELQPLH